MKENSTQHFLGLIFCTLFFANSAFAQLAAGDIAIIGVNTDGPSTHVDEFSIVTLASIPSGTTIYFSDYYWDNTNTRWGNNGLNGTTLNSVEGIIRWTTTSTIAAATVFKISLTAGTPSVSGLPGTLSIASGWSSSTIGPFGSSENLFIYQSNDNGVTPSNWIFGWCNGLSTSVSSNNNWQSSNSPILGQLSMLPTALTNGTNAISFAQNGSGSASNPSFDNNVYNIGSLRSGDKAALLAAITTTSNWVGNETTAYDIAPTSTYFSGANAFNIGAFPVEWLSFQAKAEESSVQLLWTVAQEQNNAYFTVLRSKDNNVYEQLQTVNSIGNHADAHTYQAQDLNPIQGISYYQIKQTDLDGKSSLSRIQTVFMEGKSSFSIYPNPNKGNFTLNLEGDSRTGEILLTNALGQVVYSEVLTDFVGKKELNLAGISQGVYALTLKEKGNKVTTLKVVVE